MDKMEEINKVIDNAIEKLNALREDKPEFHIGELVWVSNGDGRWIIGMFKRFISGTRYKYESVVQIEDGNEKSSKWIFCRKFDEIEIDI